MKAFPVSLVLLTLFAGQAAHAADVTAQPTLTLGGARRVVAAALAYARSHAAPGAAVAVVDAGGHTICLERLDGTFPASADVSIGKARTAANFGRPTRGMEDSINKNRPALAAVEFVADTPRARHGLAVNAVDNTADQQIDIEIAR